MVDDARRHRQQIGGEIFEPFRVLSTPANSMVRSEGSVGTLRDVQCVDQRRRRRRSHIPTRCSGWISISPSRRDARRTDHIMMRRLLFKQIEPDGHSTPTTRSDVADPGDAQVDARQARA